ncbi:phage head spike fiber domain-containing protein [Flavivirga jejuensis]|uniref:GDSL-like lipase/acylhydrolase family protein n=1 Tax=Flavivirga jejuensis TaxID=870487 RepID=A0ABT8WQ98_9FLAO|nr:hypothetical protein [Flavivirga jejuensis]MDO5975343.1 hypothetical protein [Flavivirga jejuensis]
MFKLFTKSLLILIITVLIIKFIDRYCIQDERFHYTYNRVFNKKEKFDIMLMGNSLSQTDYNTTYVDSVLNTTSINIGGWAHHFFLTNAIFQKLIDNEYSYPKQLLVIEISPWQFKDYDEEKLKFLQMAGLDEIEYSTNYFQTVNKFFEIKEYPKVLSSTIRFHDELTDEWVKTYNSLGYLEKANANGFQLNDTHKLDDNEKKTKLNYYDIASQYSKKINNAKEIKIDDLSEKMILGIIKNCKEKGINLLFVTAPALYMIYSDEEGFGKMKYIENLLKSNDAKHINFNLVFNSINLTLDDFSDFTHLNKFGNRKLAPLFLDSITSMFSIKKNTVNAQNENEKIKLPKFKNVINDNIIGWSRVRSTLNKLNLKFDQDQEVYRISRNTNTKNSYIQLANNNTQINQDYRVSVIAKKGDLDNYLGLRIVSVYPNRADALFNLDSGTIRGVSKAGNFDNQKANIEPLGNGWYKCSLSAKVGDSKINVILGPTNNSRKASSWEGVTNDNNDILIVPKSLRFEKNNYKENKK